MSAPPGEGRGVSDRREAEYMTVNSAYWMEYSIDIAKKAPQSSLQAAAVLVSDHDELICSAYAGEEGGSWSSVLLGKARKLKVSNAKSIYITINTLLGDYSFGLSKLLSEILISEIYVGLPDPALTCYIEGDPVITLNHVYRYSEKLQREILKQNACFYTVSEQSIKYSPYYFENRISNLVIEKLKSKGFVVSREEININKQKGALASLLSSKYGVECSEVNTIIDNALSESFNDKYATYNYSYDTRSLDPDWKKGFMSLYEQFSTCPLVDNNILNVGVGSGNEAIALFSNCTNITFVDIAPAGLEKIKKQIPASKVIISSADDLSAIPDNSYDLYVSLRTYNSSFFDIKEAVSEAHRVLKSSATMVVSVANGFLCSEQQRVIPGLIIPGAEFVDIYRGMDTAKLVTSELLRKGFKNIRKYFTDTEIYILAVKPEQSYTLNDNS